MILTSSLQFTVLLKCPNSFWTILGSPNKEGVETLNGMFCSTVCGFWLLRTSTFIPYKESNEQSFVSLYG